MSSGSYHPGPVRAVEIPKKGKQGGVRVLGIPNVVDRIAMVGGVGVGAQRGAGLPRGLLWLSSRALARGRGYGLPGAVLEARLGC